MIILTFDFFFKFKGGKPMMGRFVLAEYAFGKTRISIGLLWFFIFRDSRLDCQFLMKFFGLLIFFQNVRHPVPVSKPRG